MLNCARTLEVTSAAVAMSTPPAAAKSKRPGISARMSFVLCPAMARFSIAAAASLALNWVVSPSFFARFDKSSKSFPVAPEMAFTFAIPCSKSLKVFMVSASPRDRPANAAACVIGLDIRLQTFLNGAVTRSTALSVTVQTFPAIAFPFWAIADSPLVAISLSDAATSILLLPFMPWICCERLFIFCSSFVTFEVALFAPLAVSSVTCATMSITVVAPLMCAPSFRFYFFLVSIFSTGCFASCSNASSVYWR